MRRVCWTNYNSLVISYSGHLGVITGPSPIRRDSSSCEEYLFNAKTLLIWVTTVTFMRSTLIALSNFGELVLADTSVLLLLGLLRKFLGVRSEYPSEYSVKNWFTKFNLIMKAAIDISTKSYILAHYKTSCICVFFASHM